MHNAVPDAVLFDERRNGACSPRGVDDVDVVVMAVGAALLRVDILPQRRVQQRTLQVVRGKSVARQQAVGIAIFDERLHGRLGRRVEAACRTEHPYHIAVLFFMAQQPGQCVIIPRESRFGCARCGNANASALLPPAEKALRMHQNALAAIVRAAQHHAVALHKIAEPTMRSSPSGARTGTQSIRFFQQDAARRPLYNIPDTCLWHDSLQAAPSAGAVVRTLGAFL